MKRTGYIALLVFSMFFAATWEALAQDPPAEPTTRRHFNQVFVKIIVPYSSRGPTQDGRVVESWIAEELKKRGKTDFFAVTDWVPVCDGLLSDDVVDNRVWVGGRINKIHYCPVGGDIPQRKDGHLLVNVGGWLPVPGCGANITLPDQPGSRAVGPVQFLAGENGEPLELEERLPYVAVIITPPPLGTVASPSDKR